MLCKHPKPSFNNSAICRLSRGHACTRALLRLLMDWPNWSALIPSRASHEVSSGREYIRRHIPPSMATFARVVLLYWCQILQLKRCGGLLQKSCLGVVGLSCDLCVTVCIGFERLPCGRFSTTDGTRCDRRRVRAHWGWRRNHHWPPRRFVCGGFFTSCTLQF